MQAQIGGGEADGAAELGAVDDFSADEIIAPKQLAGISCVAALQRIAHAAGMDGVEAAACVEGDFLHYFNCKAQSFARFPQEVGRALATFAEVEIIAHHHAADAKATNQNVLHERARLNGCQLRVETQHNQPVEPEAGKRLRFCRLWRQAMDDGAAGEEISRVGLERQHGAGLAKLLGKRERAFDHGLMAPVHAVKIADRHNGAFQPHGRARRVAGDDEAFGEGGQIQAL